MYIYSEGCRGCAFLEKSDDQKIQFKQNLAIKEEKISREEFL